MKRNTIIHYNPTLKEKARHLRNKCTLSETLLWSKIRRKSLGYEFHRQVAINEFIVDFYCHELRLAIEVDGSSHEGKYEYDLQRGDILLIQGQGGYLVLSLNVQFGCQIDPKPEDM
jgi:very-short-patch-repair endonuclease